MLVAQLEQVRSDGKLDADLLVVDNDPDGGAATLVRTWAPLVRYVHEPTPGLSAVRNRALMECSQIDLLAFMDDDGRPEPGWIKRLAVTWSEANCPAAVAGRVLEQFESAPDAWIVAGGFFRRRSLPTGTEVPTAPAGNLLLDMAAVRRLGLTFDDRFGLSGGEDTLFTRQLTARGGRIVWCEEAQVVDLVPSDRATRRWVLARARSHGNNACQVELAMVDTTFGSIRVRVRHLLGGAARWVGGHARHLVGVTCGSLRHQARGLRTAHRGVGMMTGATGRVVQEYSR
jgi:glycosyltransferase involved in cell wall biosynthesis